MSLFLGVLISLPESSMGCSVVCDYDISLSYSLVFCTIYHSSTTFYISLIFEIKCLEVEIFEHIGKRNHVRVIMYSSAI